MLNCSRTQCRVTCPVGSSLPAPRSLEAHRCSSFSLQYMQSSQGVQLAPKLPHISRTGSSNSCLFGSGRVMSQVLPGGIQLFEAQNIQRRFTCIMCLVAGVFSCPRRSLWHADIRAERWPRTVNLSKLLSWLSPSLQR